MRNFLLLLILSIIYTCIQANLEEVHKRGQLLIKECKNEIPHTEDDLTPLINNQLPTTENGKCLIGCLLHKAGYLKDSVYQKDFVQNRIRYIYEKSPEKMEKSLEELAKCDNTVLSNDKCESGAQLYTCLKTLTYVSPPKW